MTNTVIKPNFDMTEIATDILAMKFKKTDTIDQCWQRFFAIMKKHGVCHGTPIFNDDGKHCGDQTANFEWTMCETLFAENMKHSIAFWYDFGVHGCKIPKAVRAYKYEDLDVKCVKYTKCVTAITPGGVVVGKSADTLSTYPKKKEVSLADKCIRCGTSQLVCTECDWGDKWSPRKRVKK